MLVKQESFKKPFLAVNTGSRLLLLLCFLMLGAGGRTLPHLSVVVLCLFPWPKSCRGVVVYMLGWLVMTHDDDTILFSSFLYYISLQLIVIRNTTKFLKVSLLSNFGLNYMLHFCMYFSDGFISRPFRYLIQKVNDGVIESSANG